MLATPKKKKVNKVSDKSKKIKKEPKKKDNKAPELVKKKAPVVEKNKLLQAANAILDAESVMHSQHASVETKAAPKPKAVV